MERLGDVIEAIKRNQPEADTSLVERAYVYSAKVHQGQLRRSGEPYLSHPLAVASILAGFRMDLATIAAGILHDTLEDTTATEEEISRLFGEDVLNLVRGVTKITKMAFGTTIEKEAANYRRMVLAMASDIRVIIIKLADRLHNLRTLEHLPEPKRKRVARETLEVYAPLAHRLGMGSIKLEMEELAFRHLEPEVYADLDARVAKRQDERDRYVEEVRGIVGRKLAEMGIKAEVLGRAKHLYSIHQKMQKQKISFDEVYDLLALRVITDSLKDCYGALGIVHSLWKPIPGKFKDYIAMPKENMYQSLHTTIIGPDGERVEFQIRTRDMHSIAEEGIAAHWKYKEGLKGGAQEEAFRWLRQSLEYVRDLKDPKEFLESFKMDLFPEDVYVFTPKGDVRPLPRGATPVDFAYAIHTEVGHRCVGAKVNGRIVPLRHQLKNGDRVEIMTSPAHHPSKDWLKFAVTGRARNKIRKSLKLDQRERSIDIGRDLLEKELKRLGTGIAKVSKSPELAAALPAMGYKGFEELLANLGYGKVSVGAVLKKILPPDLLAAASPKEGPLEKIARRIGFGRAPESIKVDGLDNILFRFSKCCNPIPGDQIVGFITRGRGISIHTADCPNVADYLVDPERKVEVSWDNAKESFYPVNIAVEGRDRSGLLAAITEAVSDAGANIASARARTGEGKFFTEMELTIKDLGQLTKILQAIRRIKGVENVARQRILTAAQEAAGSGKGKAS